MILEGWWYWESQQLQGEQDNDEKKQAKQDTTNVTGSCYKYQLLPVATAFVGKCCWKASVYFNFWSRLRTLELLIIYSSY